MKVLKKGKLYRLIKDDCKYYYRCRIIGVSCNIFLMCIKALAYLRLIELKLEDAGIHMTSQRTMDLMRNLHSCLCWSEEKEMACRMIEESVPDQARILAAFGYEADRGSCRKSRGYMPYR